ncbi:MAG: HD domain-containing protein [Desulfuromonadales bacterium]|nr:HD domain-containing protein [Desulfuromonadales bacterium]
MEVLDSQVALKIATLFSGAVKGIGFYPASHPAIRQPLLELDKILASALGRTQEISWGVIDGAMFFGEHLFISPSTAIVDLTNRMMEKDIERVIVTAGLTFDELQSFVRLFSVKGSSFETLIDNLKQEGIVHIRLVRPGEETLESEEENPDKAENGSDHLVMHGQALSAIRGICRDIERGRIPNSAPIIRVVDRMLGLTMQEPSILVGLTMIKDYDNYTFNHCVNVGILAMALGASLGLDAMSVKSLGIAGELHDIGKTMISKKILNKPGKLSSAEFDEMKRHSELGGKIVREMQGLDPHIAQIVLGHHIHFNRKGYPEWAQKLPFNQLIDIVAVADTYDAITTLRVYQSPVNPHAALNAMLKLSGTFLDGSLVASFIEMMGKYPVGTLVRLDTNEVGIVYRPNPLDEEAPIVKILIENDGTRLSVPREQSLVEQDGSCYASIVAVADPHLKNIDVGKFVSSGNY